MPDELNERKVNAQVVELAFLALQFVALTDVFSGLNIPDETFLPDVMQSLLPDEVISRLNELNQLGPRDLPELVPPPVDVPVGEIIAGGVEVDPAPESSNPPPLRATRPVAPCLIDRVCRNPPAGRTGGKVVGAIR